MGELCEWIERLLNPEGNSISEGGKSIWIRVSSQSCKKFQDDDGYYCKFSMPLSGFVPFEDGDLYKFKMVNIGKTGQRRLVKHVHYRMMRSWHSNCQFSKKIDGKYVFKRKNQFQNNNSQNSQNYSNTDSVGSGRKRGNKQYGCKTCRKQVDIERDNQGNAYCMVCGNKMFQ